MKGMQSATAPQPRTRASKQARREQLIEATLNAIERKGLTAFTLADVADGAGLSRGIVNFHFESKDKLLVAVLMQLSDEYDRNWRAELAAAPADNATRLRTLMLADLSPRICTPGKLAAWFGFYGEAASRPDLRDLCWGRDDAYLDALDEICTGLKAEVGYDFAPAKTAMSLYAMQEGLWLRLMLGNGELRLDEAVEVSLASLGLLFPRHFSPEGDLLDRG
ncbi:MAG: TetR family transcriptional regulator C-terminal domain-containing protein [Pseudomonadota bacterium]